MSLQRMVSALIVLLAMTLSTSTQSAMLADSDDDGFSLESDQPRPPLTPRWVFLPWAWEDDDQDARAVIDLVDGYQSRGIPLGAVVIDSPWATNYNTFEFGPNYANPAELMSELKQRGIRVILWTTGMINVSSTDGANLGKADNYDEAYAAGYFVNRGQTYNWWKGVGSGIDFFNPAAVAWWEKQLDKIMSLGVSGWKVDYAERQLPSKVETAAGTKTQAEYGDAYYRAFYRYTISRDPEGIILARPFDDKENFAPVDANPAGWVGDQNPSWGNDGIDEAVDNMMISAEHGYAVVGSDIGGYAYGERDAEQFVRWAQLGALSPLMENGGRGEHRPWRYGPEVLNIYRRFAILHYELVPYLYSLGIEAHRTGTPILRQTNRNNRQYQLGPDLLVVPMTGAGGQRAVELPEGERWYDFWDDDEVLEGGARFQVSMPLDRAPLYIRSGAILPLQVEDDTWGHGGAASADALTLLIYPAAHSRIAYYPDPSHKIDIEVKRQMFSGSVQIGAGQDSFVLRIKESSAPASVSAQQRNSELSVDEIATWDAFDRPGDGWYYDAAGQYLWIRLTGDGSPLSVSYRF